MKQLLLLISLTITIFATAQSAAEAEKLFNNKQYQKSLAVYEQLLKRRPADALLNYKAARSAYELSNYFVAAHYFEKSGNKYTLTPYYLGESLALSYQFEKAVPALQQFIASKSADEQKRTHAETLLKTAEIGRKLMKRVEDITIIDSSIVAKADFLKFYKFSADLGTLNREAVRLRNKITDKIIFTNQRDDRTCFSDTANGNFNLYTSYKLMDKWGAKTSLSKNLNTTANENFPFLMPDGITLYFASDGENSMGGYDIFMTRYAASSKDFLAPDNVGFPFNSEANDYMMVLDELQKTGWFATDRNQPTGKVAIYSFQLSDAKKYLTTTDSVELYQVAKLQKYKLAKSKKTQPTKTTMLASDNQKNIIINDSTRYGDVSEFKSTKAQLIYNEAQLMQNELTELKNLIATSRQAYANAETSQKQALASKINQLEPLYIQLQKDLISKKKGAINEEQKYLEGK